jgi:hypothetical protein
MECEGGKSSELRGARDAPEARADHKPEDILLEWREFSSEHTLVSE